MRTKGVKQFLALVIVFAMMFTMMVPITAIAAGTVTGITVTGAGGASTVVKGSTLAMSAAVLPADATDPSVAWSVAAGTGTATITSSGVLTGTGVGTVTVIATAKDGSGIVGIATITVTAAPVAVTGITVTGAGGASTVVNGSTLTMSAAVLPTNATDSSVTWLVVPGTGTATITSSGVLTGTGVGTVTVIATAKDGSGISGTKTITVIAPVAVTGITVTGAGNAVTVLKNKTLTMSAAILPAGATNQSVAWSVTAGTGTATINATTGVLTGTGVGTVTVKATANDGSNVSGTTTITVTEPVTGITVTGAGGASTVANGGTLAMSAAVLPTTATDPSVTWSVTAGTGTATINSTGVLTGTGVGTVTVKATAHDGSGITGVTTITVTSAAVAVTGITVTGAGGASTVTNGSTLTMSAAVLPANATDSSVTWSVTAGTGTATINATTGVLTGTGAGTVTVKATANDGSGISGTAIITVTAVVPIAVTGIIVTGKDGVNSVVIGNTLAMSAAVLPTTATNKSVTWSVATLVGGTAAIDSTTGVLTGLGLGTVTVKATANDGSGVIGTKTITVVTAPIAVTSITVTGSGGANTVTNGGTLQMKAAVLPTNATDSSVTWSVAAGTGTATINATTGVLTGSGVGTVTVKAAANDGSGITGTKEIAVVAVVVTGITVTGEANVITVVKDSGSLQMVADVLPTNATDSSVTWSVAAGTGTATINATTGVLIGTGLGTVTVKATANDGSGVYGNKMITVVADPIAVTSITVTGKGNATTVALNGTLQMEAAATPANATELSVVWSVTPGTGSATIDSEGKLTGVRIGTVTVTATSGSATGSKVITVNNPFTLAAPVLPSFTTTGVPMPLTIANYGTGTGAFVWSWTGVTLQDTTTPTSPVDVEYSYTAAGNGSNDMTITPKVMLDFGKTYTLTIPAGAVTDSLSNPNAAFSFEFTTPTVGVSSVNLTAGVSSVNLTEDATGVPLDGVITLTTNGTLNPLIPITLSTAGGDNCKLTFISDGTKITVVPVDKLAGGNTYTLTIPAGALVGSTSAVNKVSSILSNPALMTMQETTGAINEASSITFTTAYNLDDLINGVYTPVTLNALLAKNSPRGLKVTVPKRYMTKIEIAYSTNSTNPLTNIDITAESEVAKITVQFGAGGPTYQAVKGTSVWNTGYEGSLTTVDDSGATIGQDIIFQAFDQYGRLLEKKRTIKLNVKGSKLDLTSNNTSVSGSKIFADLILNSGKTLQSILKEYTLDELTLSVIQG